MFFCILGFSRRSPLCTIIPIYQSTFCFSTPLRRNFNRFIQCQICLFLFFCFCIKFKFRYPGTGIFFAVCCRLLCRLCKIDSYIFCCYRFRQVLIKYCITVSYNIRYICPAVCFTGFTNLKLKITGRIGPNIRQSRAQGLVKLYYPAGKSNWSIKLQRQPMFLANLCTPHIIGIRHGSIHCLVRRKYIQYTAGRYIFVIQCQIRTILFLLFLPDRNAS